MDSYNRLIDQIDAFIRKYYKNQMLRGSLLFVAIFLSSFLVTSTLEYLGRFDHVVRAMLYYAFLALNGFVLVKYMFIPIGKLCAFGKQISKEQAAEIIGSFFPNIADRLKNTLQLNDALEYQSGNLELLRASVQQRADELNVVPFVKAIDYSKNKRYMKYVLPSLLVFLGICISAPALLFEGSKRIINYNKDYVPQAPFAFVCEDLKPVEEGNDALISLTVKGEELPDKVYLITESGKFPMRKLFKDRFSGTIRKPSKTAFIYFEANGFISKTYRLPVYGKTQVGRITAHISYPAYTGRKAETCYNVADLTVPEGTSIAYVFEAKNVSAITARFDKQLSSSSTPKHQFKLKAFKSDTLSVSLKNNFSQKTVTSKYHIQVIKDAFPAISVSESIDSVNNAIRYFTGSIGDDYGLSRLKFVYTIRSKDGGSENHSIPVMPVTGTAMGFDFAVDFSREDLKLDDEVSYYFVVTDNDAVNGQKSMKSDVYTYEVPGLEELNEQRELDQEKTNDQLNDLIQQSNQFKKDVTALKKELLNTKSSGWNKQQKIDELKLQQQQIMNDLKAVNQKIEQSTDQKNQLSELDKEILEKQKLIEELLNEVMDDELMKLLEELDKLMKANDQPEMKEKMQQIDKESDALNKQLDRSLEMLKRLQVNEKIDDVQKELEQLSNDQKQLTEDIANEKISKEQQIEEQKKIHDRFDQLKDDLKRLNELNKSLESPMQLSDSEEQEKAISDELNNSHEKLESGKQEKAKESQQNAAEEMQELSKQLEQDQQVSNQAEAEEDIETLRRILESLVNISLDQEMVLTKFGKLNNTDPAYRVQSKRQRRIVDDTKLLKDSLLSLAKRQPKIASFIDQELNAIDANLNLVLYDLDEYKKRELAIHQQYVMTSYNNLALLLNESLQAMQQQMNSQSKGNGSCSKPGGKGKGSPGDKLSNSDMKQMLKKQLEQMQQGQGKNQGGNKPGESGQGGLGNKEISKMAAEQALIRKRLEELKKELNEDGSGAGNKLNPLLKQLEEQEKQLVNKNFDTQLVTRQKDIMTRLLESDKALLERDFEEKRESKSGKNENSGNQIRFDEYTRKKLGQIELIRKVDPLYNGYYRKLANDFFNDQLVK